MIVDEFSGQAANLSGWGDGKTIISAANRITIYQYDTFVEPLYSTKNFSSTYYQVHGAPILGITVSDVILKLPVSLLIMRLIIFSLHAITKFCEKKKKWKIRRKNNAILSLPQSEGDDTLQKLYSIRKHYNALPHDWIRENARFLQN